MVKSSECNGWDPLSAPNLFIVGAGKAGTSALTEYLAENPEIYMAPGKEFNYFGRDLDYRAPRLDAESYIDLFKEGRKFRYRAESSVQYLLSKTAAKEIKEACPNSKILIMVRNPVEVMHARHSQNVYAGDETVIDFEEAIKLEGQRRKGYEIPSGVSCTEWLFYREWVAFEKQINRYFEAFGRHNVWVGLFDDLCSDPYRLYSSIMKFLDLDSPSPKNFAIVNRSRRPRVLLLQRALTGRYPIIKKVGRLFVPNARLRNHLVEIGISKNTKIEKRSPISETLLSKLNMELRPGIEELGKLINRDLSFWYE